MLLKCIINKIYVVDIFVMLNLLFNYTI